MEGDYPKFARAASSNKFGRQNKADEEIWKAVRENARQINQEFRRNPHGVIPSLRGAPPEGHWLDDAVISERVPAGQVWAFDKGVWNNPLLEELQERRAAQVAGSNVAWPDLDDGTEATQEQFQEAMYEWYQDDIVIQFDGVGNEVPIHSRWGVLRDRAYERPTGAVEHDKRSGARYWPIGRV